MSVFSYQDQLNVVSISGGKDSLATTLLCMETQPLDSIHLVHADTGHEHPDTVEYLDYLEIALDMPIKKVRADFTERFALKRHTVLTKWPKEGIADEVVQAAAKLLETPTGIPMLDLCIASGRFPSQVARFCTRELKIEPLIEYQLTLSEEHGGKWIWSWQGIRSDESKSRQHMAEFENLGDDDTPISIFRPLLKWTAIDTFEAAALKGVLANPLYRQGMDRIGCMPCINANKSMLAEIAQRWPWVIEKLREWERIVTIASKGGPATFFNRTPPKGKELITDEDIWEFNRIDATVEWAKTSTGGKQYDIFKTAPPMECSSSYGLCE